MVHQRLITETDQWKDPGKLYNVFLYNVFKLARSARASRTRFLCFAVVIVVVIVVVHVAGRVLLTAQ